MSFRIITLTQGNLNNNHLYLSSIIDIFPPDSIGGPNESTAGTVLEIHCGIGEAIFTDIAGDKKIFRKRSWVGDFFLAHSIQAGDKVVIERTDPNRYHIYPARPQA